MVYPIDSNKEQQWLYSYGRAEFTSWIQSCCCLDECRLLKSGRDRASPRKGMNALIIAPAQSKDHYNIPIAKECNQDWISLGFFRGKSKIQQHKLGANGYNGSKFWWCIRRVSYFTWFHFTLLTLFTARHYRHEKPATDAIIFFRSSVQDALQGNKVTLYFVSALCTHYTYVCHYVFSTI